MISVINQSSKHNVLPKGRSFTANSTFSNLSTSQPSFSYLRTVHLSWYCLSSDIFVRRIVIHRRDLVCSSREWSELPDHHGDSGPGTSSSSCIISTRPFFTSLPGLSNLAVSRAKGGIYWRQDAGTWTSDIRRLLTAPLFTRTTTEATATSFTTPLGERRPGACI